MRLRVAALAAAVLLAACSTAPSTPPQSNIGSVPPEPTATAVPSATAADPTAVYALVATQVEAIRGLQPTTAVAPVLIDQATLTKNLTADFDRTNPPAAVAINERELIGLGLLPAGSSFSRARSPATTRPRRSSSSS